jgi:dTDP-4-amino-4,6-dideoxygalactose transaminase
MLDLKLEYEYMKDDIDAAISRCLEHQQWIFGPEIKQLEDEIAGYLKVRHCIGVSSGTEALVLILRALAIKLKGREYFDKTDRILTTPFTFTATGDAILRAGATPVFVDIDPVTFNIDPAKVRAYLSSVGTNTSHSRVTGIIPVHLYGRACDMEEIGKIAEEYDLFVVEDVAQAFGCEYGSKKLGSFGTAGAFSFFPSKNLGCFGDAGLVSTDDEELAGIVRMLIKHGGKDKYNVDHIGYNARMDTLQAAVLLAKFRHLDYFNQQRRKIALGYDEELSGLPGITLPASSRDHVYHQYTIAVEKHRDSLQKFLAERGVGSMVYYPIPLHNMGVFRDRCIVPGHLMHSETAANQVLSLPIEPLMQKEDVLRVSEAVRKFCRISRFPADSRKMAEA